MKSFKLPSELIVGLPCFNAEPYLFACLASIELQTEENWKLIAIDDCSSDRTLEILVSFQSRFKDRVTVVAHKRNQGLPHCLNEISGLSPNHSLIVRMDADDIMRPSRLRSISEIAKRGHQFIASGAFTIDEQNRARLLRKSWSTKTLIHPTVAFTKAWATENPYPTGPESDRCEDLLLWRMSQPAVKFTKEPELFFRSSVSWKKRIRTASSHSLRSSTFRSIVRVQVDVLLGLGELITGRPFANPKIHSRISGSRRSVLLAELQAIDSLANRIRNNMSSV
jgi:Glycosyl transferase family 2